MTYSQVAGGCTVLSQGSRVVVGTCRPFRFAKRPAPDRFVHCRSAYRRAAGAAGTGSVVIIPVRRGADGQRRDSSRTGIGAPVPASAAGRKSIPGQGCAASSDLGKTAGATWVRYLGVRTPASMRAASLSHLETWKPGGTSILRFAFSSPSAILTLPAIFVNSNCIHIANCNEIVIATSIESGYNDCRLQ